MNRSTRLQAEAAMESARGSAQTVAPPRALLLHDPSMRAIGNVSTTASKYARWNQSRRIQGNERSSLLELSTVPWYLKF